MVWQVDLKKYFTVKTIALALKQLPKIETPVMDLIYKNRRQHPFPVIGISEISEIIRNVPVVRRGSRAISLTGRQLKTEYIEPQGVDVFDFVNGVELNNLKILIQEGITQGLQEWINSKVEKVRKVVRATSEVLSDLSLTGKIVYAMQTDSGLDTYEVDFGSTLSFTPEKLWDTEITDVQSFHKLVTQITADLRGIKKHIRKNSFGYGSTVIFLVGSKVFDAVAKLIPQYQNETRIAAKVEDETITLLGFKLKLFDFDYYDPKSKEFKPIIPAEKICAIATDAPFTFFYIALDDLKAGLRPMPLFIFPKETDDPSGYKLIGRSKPFPVPVPKAICWTTVVK